MPLGRLAGTRLSLSYAVFVAAAIVMAVVLTMAGRPASADLPRAAALGVGFWLAGWIVQAATHFALTWVFGLQMTHLNIGLIGVDATPRYWSAQRTLVICVGTVAALLLLGCFFRLVEGGFQLPVLSRSSDRIWTVPSIGFASYDSIWRTGAWLCWVQAFFQMYPLPRSLGRQAFGALARICGRRLDIRSQTVIFRRCLIAVAVLTVLVAIVLASVEGNDSVPKWPWLFLMGVLLLASSHGSDLAKILAGFQPSLDGALAPPDSDAADHDRRKRGMIFAIRRLIRARRDQQRARMTLKKERSEAIDADRLDDILNRLYRDGNDSLSVEDRKILDRVSQNLRDQRRSESEQAEESD